MTKVRGLRGATSSDSNTKDAIVEATTELLKAMVDANDIDADDVAAAIFSTTPDLNAEFPAVAARKNLGWNYVALMCGHEMNVPDAQTQCIRVLVLVNTDKAPQDLKNVYLRDATNLMARGIIEDMGTSG